MSQVLGTSFQLYARKITCVIIHNVCENIVYRYTWLGDNRLGIKIVILSVARVHNGLFWVDVQIIKYWHHLYVYIG